MPDKQLEFEFMKNNISKIISLGYIGGQDEDLGGYCEPLIIRYFDGMEQYVLHKMAQSREEGEKGVERIVNNHNKLLFPNKSKLLEAWGWTRSHLGTNSEWAWEKTNAVCGCDTTIKEFYKTRRENRIKEAA